MWFFLGACVALGSDAVPVLEQAWRTDSVDVQRLVEQTKPHAETLRRFLAGSNHTPQPLALPKRQPQTLRWLGSLVGEDPYGDLQQKRTWEDEAGTHRSQLSPAWTGSLDGVQHLRFRWSTSTDNPTTGLTTGAVADVLLTYDADVVRQIYVHTKVAPGAPVDVQTFELWTLTYNGEGALSGGRMLSWTQLNGQATKGERRGLLKRVPMTSRFFDKRGETPEPAPRAFWE